MQLSKDVGLAVLGPVRNPKRECTQPNPQALPFLHITSHLFMKMALKMAMERPFRSFGAPRALQGRALRLPRETALTV